MEKKQELDDRPVSVLSLTSMIEMEDGYRSTSFDNKSFDNHPSLISKQAGEGGNITRCYGPHLSHMMNCSTIPRKRNENNTSRSEQILLRLVIRVEL